MDDALNAFWAIQHARSINTAAKAWWNAKAMHPAIFRALRMESTGPAAIYAAMPFRLWRDPDGNHCILVAMPCPKFFSDDCWLTIETVLAWYPSTGAICDLEDDSPDKILGEAPFGNTAVDVYAEPFAFFRAMAETRAQWVTRYLAEYGKDWRRPLSEPRLIPGLLVTGDVAKVRWASAALPAELRCHGMDPVAVNRAILRQSNLPRALPANNHRLAA